MITNIKIENYKSVELLELSLGRVNIFIGENGAGKSNILEAIALAGAANGNKLDNEFLSSRGIRPTTPTLMRSGFSKGTSASPITISVEDNEGLTATHVLSHDNEPYSSWESEASFKTSSRTPTVLIKKIAAYVSNLKDKDLVENFVSQIRKLADEFEGAARAIDAGNVVQAPTFSVLLPADKDGIKGIFGTDALSDFMIFAPENSSLRVYESESQIEPLGIRGEGLLRFLHVMSKSRSKTKKAEIEKLKENLRIFSWFDDIKVSRSNSRGDIRLSLTDVNLSDGCESIDRNGVNEGFLYLAFYFALFISELTPKFFAIDNIDTALNPKMCERLISDLVKIAKEQNKQAIITTHNPATLDGLNLDDSDQRLFIVTRGRRGQTKVRRFHKPPESNVRLSEAFLRGALGGLPKGF